MYFIHLNMFTAKQGTDNKEINNYFPVRINKAISQSYLYSIFYTICIQIFLCKTESFP